MCWSIIMNVFRELIKNIEYLRVALHLYVDDVKLVSVAQVLAEIGHLLHDDLLVALESLDYFGVILVHYMHVHVLLEILRVQNLGIGGCFWLLRAWQSFLMPLTDVSTA